MAETQAAEVGTAPALIVKKRIAAPPEEIFPLWLDAASWGTFMTPMGTHATVHELDARVGGAYAITMEGGAKTFPHRGVYKVIEPPTKLAFTWISDGTMGRETLVTVELRRIGSDETELTLTHTGLPVGADAPHRGGWTEILEILTNRF
jgi:uncharacterized protein YndB with AHSA1/START domain